jgi:hypothetical protein
MGCLRLFFYSPLSLIAGKQGVDLYFKYEWLHKNSMIFEIASRHVYWDQDKSYNGKNGSQKISLDCPCNDASIWTPSAIIWSVYLHLCNYVTLLTSILLYLSYFLFRPFLFSVSHKIFSSHFRIVSPKWHQKEDEFSNPYRYNTFRNIGGSITNEQHLYREIINIKIRRTKSPGWKKLPYVMVRYKTSFTWEYVIPLYIKYFSLVSMFSAALEHL